MGYYPQKPNCLILLLVLVSEAKASKWDANAVGTSSLPMRCGVRVPSSYPLSLILTSNVYTMLAKKKKKEDKR